jgi:hypothetical protein
MNISPRNIAPLKKDGCYLTNIAPLKKDDFYLTNIAPLKKVISTLEISLRSKKSDFYPRNIAPVKNQKIIDFYISSIFSNHDQPLISQLFMTITHPYLSSQGIITNFFDIFLYAQKTYLELLNR